jgi:hypothetical protein
MFTRAIFIRPDSELIRESVCACAKLFADEVQLFHGRVELQCRRDDDDDVDNFVLDQHF